MENILKEFLMEPANYLKIAFFGTLLKESRDEFLMKSEENYPEKNSEKGILSENFDRNSERIHDKNHKRFS